MKQLVQQKRRSGRRQASAAHGRGREMRAVARRNRETVKAAFDAYHRGDLSRVAELADPDLVVTQAAEMPDAETFHGRQGFAKAIDAWAEAWDDIRAERLCTRDVGDHVVTTVRQRARGKRSGVEVEGLFTFVFTLRAGRLVSWRMFADEATALEAVGLHQLATASGVTSP